MTSNKLKLNENKTDTSIDPTDSVSKIKFDSHNMTMIKQVSSLCQSIHFQLRNLRRIKRYLDKDTLHHVVRALVLSLLDYGNLLLFGATSYELDRVQRLQTSAARSTPLREHIITPSLRELHWLPTRERTHLRLLFSFLCFNKTTPHYNHLTVTLLSSTISSINRLNVPRANKVLGQKAFSVAGPMIWNNLPTAIRESNTLSAFHKVLKTHLFPS
jgi:hypothetical protein